MRTLCDRGRRPLLCPMPICKPSKVPRTQLLTALTQSSVISSADHIARAWMTSVWNIEADTTLSRIVDAHKLTVEPRAFRSVEELVMVAGGVVLHVVLAHGVKKFLIAPNLVFEDQGRLGAEESMVDQGWKVSDCCEMKETIHKDAVVCALTARKAMP